MLTTLNRDMQMKTHSLALVAVSFACALGQAVPVFAQGATSKDNGSLPTDTLAIVNGVAIPLARLDDAMRAARQPDTPELRRIFKQELIAREVLRQGAEKQTYGMKPAVQEAVNASKAAAETELYLRDNIRPAPITDAQVKARYQEIVGSLGDEEYKLRILSVADDATAAKVLERLSSGVAFDALVREYSIAASKEDGGEMPWVSFKTPVSEGKTQGVPLAVAQAATRLSAGGVTPAPVVVDNVRVIVKLDAKRATQVPTFDQMKGAIRQQLQVLALKNASAGFIGAQMQRATIQQ
ncbi:peptidylprolyl isomerase [Cupriavidus sp. CuC1]|uniref:peptidylprolyl isomerase n=1 Tax=Cupriavidus sp. CuC1 TaxID=3373131 RepID=UPI0037D037C5